MCLLAEKEKETAVLLSMTGFGDARNQNERLSVAVEVRSVNNRYLRISTKCPDTYAGLEGEIEKTVRGSIVRGTVTIMVRVDRLQGESLQTLSLPVLESYWRQLHRLAEKIQVAAPNDLGSLLQLPGIVIEESGSGDCQADWPVIQAALATALEKLREFRRAEGRSMEQELRVNCRLITGKLQQVEQLAPQVVRDFRDRLEVRVGELLQAHDVQLDSSDLIREVSIFSERCDITEEMTRLKSHLDQFDLFLDSETSLGRKLEFLSQEMFREINTIGSKANNVPIAHCVVEMKAAIEKIREILQNIE